MKEESIESLMINETDSKESFINKRDDESPLNTIEGTEVKNKF